MVWMTHHTGRRQGGRTRSSARAASTGSRLTIALLLAAGGTIAGVASLGAQQASAAKSKAKSTKDSASATAAKPDTVQHFSGVIGVAVDSLHGMSLEGATVSVVGTNRHGTTDAQGQFRIDSVPPGEYRLALTHPELDTLGLAVATQPIAMPVGRYAVVRLATPSQSVVLNLFCPKEKMRSGPVAVVGRVLDADTDAPDSGARVSLDWTQLDVGAAIGVKHIPVVRTASVDDHGVFFVCGVPGNVKAALRASLGREITAAVPVNTQDQVLILTMLHVAHPDTAKVVVATNTGPGGSATKAVAVGAGLKTGRAALSGRVTDQTGKPLQGVNMSVEGAASTTNTNADGTYSLRGLPAGTQALVVRHVGYAMQDVTVDLSNVTEHRADVKMMPAPPMLAAVTVEGKRDKGLRDVGFSTRSKAGLGQYLTEDQIAQRQPMQMTDLFTQMRGIRMDYSSGYPMITDSRDAGGGCVSYVIDGVPQQMPDPQDFNDFIHPDEVSAVEVYTAAEAPAQFQTGGNSSCVVIVIWTKTKIGG